MDNETLQNTARAMRAALRKSTDPEILLEATAAMGGAELSALPAAAREAELTRRREMFLGGQDTGVLAAAVGGAYAHCPESVKIAGLFARMGLELKAPVGPTLSGEEVLMRLFKGVETADRMGRVAAFQGQGGLVAQMAAVVGPHLAHGFMVKATAVEGELKTNLAAATRLLDATKSGLNALAEKHFDKPAAGVALLVAEAQGEKADVQRTQAVEAGLKVGRFGLGNKDKRFDDKLRHVLAEAKTSQAFKDLALVLAEWTKRSNSVKNFEAMRGKVAQGMRPEQPFDSVPNLLNSPRDRQGKLLLAHSAAAARVLALSEEQAKPEVIAMSLRSAAVGSNETSERFLTAVRHHLVAWGKAENKEAEAAAAVMALHGSAGLKGAVAKGGANTGRKMAVPEI